MGFLAVTETTGEYLTNAILGELEKNGLDIQKCRGQAYDSGSNAKIFFVAIFKFQQTLENYQRYIWELSLKPLSDTRWESRMEAAKAALLQFDDVVQCIENFKKPNETIRHTYLPQRIELTQRV
ncbi:DUF4371 domain-containing protein [Trichonephila clavipes]|nr:DUF4371 domain-containing protein [Trichonephila clavipes]